MYLKSIRLEGFKSFADKTVFELNKGITAIVGPNGSGKSNIVDAIRWVLGEQSVKNLRGLNGMTDVIFNGTEKRVAQTRASVILTFDNSDHYLNSEYEEIEVKRCVYKTGENEYYLNNTRVRLKDVTELFIDTGGGLDAFNIISQGSVTDIVNSKPTERRQIFESAAGVLKYKKRKEESLRKLDKTKENLVRVKLIIDELESTVTPLKEQSEIAEKYVKLKEELKSLEIALSAKEITELNSSYNNLKKQITDLNEKIESFNKSILTNELEKLKLEIVKNDEKIQNLNKDILCITEELTDITSKKNITMERAKYDYSKDELKSNLLKLKEEELSVSKELELLINESKVLKEKGEELAKTFSLKDQELKNLDRKRISISDELLRKNREKDTLHNRYEILKSNIENNEKVPYAVKNVLNNPRLKGVHNTIANLLTVSDEYLVALDTSLSASLNFIVVSDEEKAKEAIRYLKDNRLGRATFLPLNIIKPRSIDADTLKRISQVNGFVGVLSDLVEYDYLYDNIIKNQLGNIIVVKDIDAMNLFGRIVDYRYRIVTLDGSILHAGGSITGGTQKNSNNINNKKELENLKNNIEEIDLVITSLEQELNSIDKDYQILSDQTYEINSKLVNARLSFDNNKNLLESTREKIKKINSDIKGINDINNNKLDDELVLLLEEFNKKSTLKDIKETELNDLKSIKDDLNTKLNNLEKKISEENSEYRSLQNELTKSEVAIGKMDVKLDNLLLLLNEEYNITYEYALANYELPFESDLAKSKVAELKREIKSLGEVNIGSIKEYERLSTRYNFLLEQQNDLEVSMSNLTDIIAEMDQIMIDKFKSTFEKVSEEFTEVFSTIFRGGKGLLRLTDPEDYLNTGIEIVAIPPGKKLNSTASLSGGEKSLTAICLLFAILNVSTVPFIILDEVEAALDEENVNMFGEYLSHKKDESQFILITHKKRMMEYADVLYGITMQELGVSKVVGVKLENI